MSLCTSAASDQGGSTAGLHQTSWNSRCSGCHQTRPFGSTACTYCGTSLVESISSAFNYSTMTTTTTTTTQAQFNTASALQDPFAPIPINFHDLHNSSARLNATMTNPHLSYHPSGSLEQQVAAAPTPVSISPDPFYASNPNNSTNENLQPRVIDLSADQEEYDSDDDCKMPATKKPRLDYWEELVRMQEQELESRKQEEQNAMFLSNSGRAFKFVETMIQMHQRMVEETWQDVTLVGQDDMVFLAEKFIACQQSFVSSNKPTHVSLAYHYTSQRHLRSIRQDGLLSHPDRQTSNIQTKHQAYFGEGVYTASNPYGFLRFGNTGLLCAVLRGQETRVGQGGTQDPNINTVIGNKSRCATPLTDEIVLRQSCQVLPIIQFPSSLVESSGSLIHNGNALLWRLHVEVQKILDDFFNQGVPSPVERVTPSTAATTNVSSLIPVGVSNPTSMGGFVTAGAATTTVVGQASGGAPSSLTSADLDKRENERYIELTRLLQNYLGIKDPALYRKVQAVITDCTARNNRKEKGYESLTASLLRQRLSPIVNEAHWERIDFYLAHVMAQKLRGQQFASTTNPGANNLSGNALSQKQPHQVPTQHQPGPDLNVVATPATGRVQPKETIHPHAVPTPWTSVAAVGGTAQQGDLSGIRARFHVQPAHAPILQTASGTTATQWNVPPNLPPNLPPPPAFLPVQNEVLHYEAPTNLVSSSDCCRRVRTLTQSDDCAICFTPLRRKGRVFQLYSCSHLFHSDCISTALQHDSRCPQCRVPVSAPQGKCPSGTLTISNTTSLCGGISDANGSIVLRYSFPSGTQLSYHETPGKPYRSTNRVAYLPNNTQGRDLLKRFKYAWSKGLLFGIGTSLTTGKDGQIIWSSVHQKSALRGGAHGFPDPNYFSNANAELDALNVPPPSLLP